MNVDTIQSLAHMVISSWCAVVCALLGQIPSDVGQVLVGLLERGIVRGTPSA
jgi:hypothetical protein